MDYQFRPIDAWPGELTRVHQRSRFDSSYTDTLNLLDRELHHLRARDVVIQLALDEGQIRLDGLPRAQATPAHDGVILAFESMHGPLKYATDVFWGWQNNLRAIALGLEALRKVERYGITKRGEQYTGWKQLGSGIAMGPPAMSREDAAWFLVEYGSPDGELSDPVGVVEALLEEFDELGESLFRSAAKILHPDAGGDAEEFKRLTEARELLLA